jgi:putative ABC transport system substrate-binding protein
MTACINRRELIALAGAAAWPIAARAQQAPMPVVGFITGSSADVTADRVSAFRKGMSEAGYVEGQNVSVEYHWLEGQFNRAPALLTEMVRRRVAVIALPGSPPAVAMAAKAATTTIPIVFSVGEDPVKLGLVPSLARPGGNATGINYLLQETDGKRLALLHELVPKAIRIAVLLNPANAAVAEITLRNIREAAGTLGLRHHVLNASTNREIDAVFATFAQERPDALFLMGDSFFNSRRIQLVNLAARDRLPAAFANREHVVAGGLMSYGGDIVESFHQVGIYTGNILKGDKPADLPVVQSTKLEFVINLQTARTIGIEVPAQLRARADEVIE